MNKKPIKFITTFAALMLVASASLFAEGKWFVGKN